MSAAASIYFYHHTPPGQSRVYKFAQLRTDGVHCRESPGTGPLVTKVVRATGAASTSSWTNYYCAHLSFPTSTIISIKRIYGESIGSVSKHDHFCTAVVLFCGHVSPPRLMPAQVRRAKGMYVCMHVCMYVYTFIKLHIAAQSGTVILVIQCHSH